MEEILLSSTRNPSEDNEKDNTTLKSFTYENKISDDENQKNIKEIINLENINILPSTVKQQESFTCEKQINNINTVDDEKDNYNFELFFENKKHFLEYRNFIPLTSPHYHNKMEEIFASRSSFLEGIH